MFRKILVLASICVLFLDLASTEPAKTPETKAGYALLDSLSYQFHEMAIKGSGGFEKVDQVLQKCMADAKKAKEANHIDKVFFTRYARMLAIMKIVVIPDPEAILGPMLEKEIDSFVMDVLGEDRKCENKGIGQVAAAFADEILNLHLYLDNQDAKAKLMKTFEEKYGAPVKK